MKIFYNAHFLLTFTSLFWAFNTIAGRGAVGEVSPLLIVSVRWFFVSLILTIICRKELINSYITLRKNKKDNNKPSYVDRRGISKVLPK